MAQPNMGPRRLFSTRLPESLSVRLIEEADRAGLSYSQFIADLLAERYGETPPSELFVTKKRLRLRGQEVLPLADTA